MQPKDKAIKAKDETGGLLSPTGQSLRVEGEGRITRLMRSMTIWEKILQKSQRKQGQNRADEQLLGWHKQIKMIETQYDLVDPDNKAGLKEKMKKWLVSAESTNQLHRAALDHNYTLIQMTVPLLMAENGRKQDTQISREDSGASFMHEERNLLSCKHNFKQELNKVSEDFGDSPLTLGSLHWSQSSQQREQSLKFIEYCLRNGADPNIANNHTLWGPLHWAAYYGDEKIVEALLKGGASPALPSCKGIFPIDIAGSFGHMKVVKQLLDESVSLHFELCQKIEKEQNKHPERFKGSEHLLDQFVKEDHSLFRFERQFLLSDYYASKLLFWACSCNLASMDVVTYILEKTTSYPEAPQQLEILAHQTAFHAVVKQTDLKDQEVSRQKLEAIYSDYSSRHKPGENRIDTKKMNNLVGYEADFEVVINNCSKLLPMRDLYAGWEKIVKPPVKVSSVGKSWFTSQVGNSSNLSPLKFQFTDSLNNTPLHIAAMHDNHPCIEFLLMKEMPIDIRNNEGLMPKELVNQQEGSISKQLLANDRVSPDPEKPLQNSYVRRSVKENHDSISCRYHKDIDRIRSEFKHNPKQPLVALKLSTKNRTIKFKSNVLLMQLSQLKFKLQCFKAVDDQAIFVMLDMSQNDYEEEAEDMEFLVKMTNLSAKIIYEKDLRPDQIHPFIPKDKQEIIIKKFDKLFNIKELKRIGVLIDIFPMHNLKDQYNMDQARKQIQVTGIAKYLPFKFRIYESYFTENFNQGSQFGDLNAFKNYFGEKRSMQYAFFDFFPAMFTLPALLTVALCVYQFITGSFDTRWNIIFAVFISFWGQILIERWKRKENHIRLEWGIVSQETKNVPNPDKTGYHKFSWQSYRKEKVDADFWKKPARIANWLAFTFLIGLSVASYVYIKMKFTSPVVQGIILNIVVGCINIVFKNITLILIPYENHRYRNDYDGSLVSKIAIFKFINIHLPIIFALVNATLNPLPLSVKNQAQFDYFLAHLGPVAAGEFQRQAENAATYKLMNQLIVSTVASQIVSGIIWNYLYFYVIYYINIMKHFTKFRTLAQKQQQNHKSYWQIWADKRPAEKDQVAQKLNERRQLFAYKGVIPDYANTDEHNASINEKNTQNVHLGGNLRMHLLMSNDETNDAAKGTPEYINRALDTMDNYMVEAVEADFLRPASTPLYDVIILTGRMQLVGFSMLYAGICPIATLMVFVNFLFDNWFARVTQIHCLRRPIQESQDTIGQFWISYLEGVTGIVSITNTFLLLVVSASFKSMLKSIGFGSAKEQLWFLILCEHLLLGLLVWLKTYVDDFPIQLRKIKERTEAELKAQEKQAVTQGSGESKFRKHKEVKTLKVEPEVKKDQPIVPVKGSPFHFLGLNPKLYNSAGFVKTMDEGLILNFQTKLFRETFYCIERSILQQKLRMMEKASSIIQVHCIMCTQRWATHYCIDCLDHMCDHCVATIHSLKHNFQGHQINRFNLNPDKSIMASRIAQPAELPSGSVWKKFEYFNFALQEENEFFDDIKEQFEFFKKAYVDLNYMDQVEGTVNFKDVFVDQNYDSLHVEDGAQLKIEHRKKFNSMPFIYQKERVDTLQAFNSEELFYMNRLAFRLFKSHGPKLTFPTFEKDLRTLQSGSFEDALTLWLNLCLETGDMVNHRESKYDDELGEIHQKSINLNRGMISSHKMIQMIAASFPQDCRGEGDWEKIVQRIYVDGKTDNKSISTLRREILASEEAKTLLKCILQKEDQ